MGAENVVTWDIVIVTLRKISDRDMQHCHFLKSSCGIEDPPPRARWLCDLVGGLVVLGGWIGGGWGGLVGELGSEA